MRKVKLKSFILLCSFLAIGISLTTAYQINLWPENYFWILNLNKLYIKTWNNLTWMIFDYEQSIWPRMRIWQRYAGGRSWITLLGKDSKVLTNEICDASDDNCKTVSKLSILWNIGREDVYCVYNQERWVIDCDQAWGWITLWSIGNDFYCRYNKETGIIDCDGERGSSININWANGKICLKNGNNLNCNTILLGTWSNDFTSNGYCVYSWNKIVCNANGGITMWQTGTSNKYCVYASDNTINCNQPWWTSTYNGIEITHGENNKYCKYTTDWRDWDPHVQCTFWITSATTSDIWWIKLGYETPQWTKKYPVQLDSDSKAFVEVPREWGGGSWWGLWTTSWDDIMPTTAGQNVAIWDNFKLAPHDTYQEIRYWPKIIFQPSCVGSTCAQKAAEFDENWHVWIGWNASNTYILYVGSETYIQGNVFKNNKVWIQKTNIQNNWEPLQINGWIQVSNYSTPTMNNLCNVEWAIEYNSGYFYWCVKRWWVTKRARLSIYFQEGQVVLD